MYYIGICDDDPVFIEYIKRLICAEDEHVEFYMSIFPGKS